MWSPTRSKTSRQWVSQYEILENNLPKSNKIINSKENGHVNDHNSDTHTYNNKIASCLWQYNKLNRRRAILLTAAIAILTLNIKFQLLGFPSRLQSYYINSYTDNNVLRDRNLVGCGEMTAEQRSLRNRNLSGCEKSPYISPDQAESFLVSSENNIGMDDLEPTHITLCKALIARNAEAEGQDYESEEEKETEGGGNPFFGFGFRVKTNGFLNVNESREICTDRERPHSAFMQMISSSIVAYVGSRFGLIYKHNCASTISSNKNLDFDVTTIQQIFSQITMQMDEKVLSLGEVVFDLCQSCIDQEYDPEYIRHRQEMKQNKIEDTHHCFLFPNRGDVHTEYVEMEEDEGPIEEILDDEGQIVNTALYAVLPLIRNRLYHASLDWAPRAHIPSHEPRSGVVIYIDATQSLPIPFSLYKSHVQEGTTHVSILSSPRCANSKLGDVGCLMYGLELKQYLQNGFRGIEVSFDLISSTAAAYSRMILSHILICPPGTITCLFPVLARQATKSSVIFESQDRLSTFHWFALLKGISDDETDSLTQKIRIIPVDESDMMQVDDEQKFVQRQFKTVKEAKNFEGDTSSSKIGQSSENVNVIFGKVAGFDFSEGGTGTNRFTGNDKLGVTTSSEGKTNIVPGVIHLSDAVADYPDIGIKSAQSGSDIKQEISPAVLTEEAEVEKPSTSSWEDLLRKKEEVTFDATGKSGSVVGEVAFGADGVNKNDAKVKGEVSFGNT